jgi:hypothetical protein
METLSLIPEAHKDSYCGVTKSKYFLFQVDITEDGVG